MSAVCLDWAWEVPIIAGASLSSQRVWLLTPKRTAAYDRTRTSQSPQSPRPGSTRAPKVPGQQLSFPAGAGTHLEAALGDEADNRASRNKQQMTALRNPVAMEM